MPKVVFMPSGKQADVRPGVSVLEASRKARAPLRVRCNGNAACLMCKVSVENQKGLSPPNDNEKRKLGDQLDKGYRLGCQARCLADVVVTIPPDPLKSIVRALLDRQNEDD